ncbi:MAG: OmpA family protein, partial [Bacteroidales bacterium]
SQINNPLNTVKDKSSDHANNDIDNGVDKGLNKVEGVFKKKDKTAKDTSKTSGSSSTQTNSGPSTSNTTTKKDNTLQSYSKYDFVPGEKVIYYDDFSQDAVGDFPALWNTNGSAEVVTTNLFPGHWAKFSMKDNAIWTDSLLNLPDNYTIEYDIVPVNGEDNSMAGYDFRIIQSENPRAYDWGAIPGKAGFLFSCEYTGRPGYRTYINSDGGEGLGLDGYNDNENYYQKINQKYHIAVWVQKSRVRLYLEQNKIIDLPKAFPVASVKMDRIRFEAGAAMISNIRIAVGLPDMRSKLMTEGKIVSYGCYFDSGSDKLKPESYGTLKEIAGVLNDNPTVKIKIVGHTDSDGGDALNLDLSKRRAAAVKAALNSTFSIDNARMQTDGMGATQPIAPNSTSEGKAKNRRVEFIKL